MSKRHFPAWMQARVVLHGSGQQTGRMCGCCLAARDAQITADKALCEILDTLYRLA